MSTPGEKLHKLREEHDMSMQELADLVGVHKGTIFKWEHDLVPLRKAARSSLERLAGAVRSTRTTAAPAGRIPAATCRSFGRRNSRMRS